MKREDIEKMANNMEALGFEIIEMKAIVYEKMSIHAILSGGYELKIMPIKNKEKDGTSDES